MAYATQKANHDVVTNTEVWTGSVDLQGYGTRDVTILAILAGNVTLTLPALAEFPQAFTYRLILSQDATGGRTLTLPAEVSTAGGAGITLTATANATDMVTLAHVGDSVWVGSALLNLS